MKGQIDSTDIDPRLVYYLVMIVKKLIRSSHFVTNPQRMERPFASFTCSSTLPSPSIQRLIQPLSKQPLPLVTTLTVVPIQCKINFIERSEQQYYYI